MTDVIASLRTSTTTSAADRKRMQQALPVIRSQVNRAIADSGELDDKVLFKASATKLTTVLAEVEKLLPNLPDRTAAVIATFLKGATSPSLPE